VKPREKKKKGEGGEEGAAPVFLVINLSDSGAERKKGKKSIPPEKGKKRKKGKANLQF